jgi:hypothetical protein
LGDIIFKLEGQEASAVQAFLKLVDAQKKAENAGKQLTRSASESSKVFEHFGRDAVAHIGGMVTGLLSVGSIVAAAKISWSSWQDEIKKSVESMKQFQNEFVNLQFLGEHFKDPAMRERVHNLAAASGVPAPEIARGMYALESMSAYASPEQRADMLAAMIRQRLASNVPLEQLVPTFTKMGGIYKGLSGTEMSNISQFLLEKAATASPQELAGEAPKMFAAGLIGKIDARTAAAIGAVMTAKTGTTAQAASGMEQVVRKVMLVGGDEEEAIKVGFGKKDFKETRESLLKEAGVKEADDAYQRILKLAARHGRQAYSAEEMKSIFGERTMKFGQVLLSDPQALEKMVAEFQKETAAGKDIVGQKIQTVLGNDPTYRIMTAGQKTQAATEAAREQPRNLVWENYNKEIERLHAEGRISGFTASVAKTGSAMDRFFGDDGVNNAVGDLAWYLRWANVTNNVNESFGIARSRLGLTEGTAQRDAGTRLTGAAAEAFGVSGEQPAAKTPTREVFNPGSPAVGDDLRQGAKDMQEAAANLKEQTRAATAAAKNLEAASRPAAAPNPNAQVAD